MKELNEWLISETSICPEPDMAKCSVCGWEGYSYECETEWEQDGWESPAYQIDLCPKCEDGGCVDDYFYSEQQIIEYEKWKENEKQTTTIRANINSNENEITKND